MIERGACLPWITYLPSFISHHTASINSSCVFVCVLHAYIGYRIILI
jgi:hypothetical protein